MAKNVDAGQSESRAEEGVIKRFQAVQCRYADSTKASHRALSEKQQAAQKALGTSLQELAGKYRERECDLRKEHAAAAAAGDAEKARATCLALSEAWIDLCKESNRAYENFWKQNRDIHEKSLAENRKAYETYLDDLKKTWSAEAAINPAELLSVAQRLSSVALHAAGSFTENRR